MNEQELDEYFQCDKSNWNEEQSLEFWEVLKEEKINKENFHFLGYEFPSFNGEKLKDKYSNYWHPEGKSSIDVEVKMDYCLFNDELNFWGINFSKEVTIIWSTFKKTLWFWNCSINILTIDHSYCVNGLEIMSCYFKDSTIIANTFFYNYLSFSDCSFKNNFLIQNNFINNNFSLYNCKYSNGNLSSIENIYRIDLTDIETNLHLELEYLVDTLKFSEEYKSDYEKLTKKLKTSYSFVKDFLTKQKEYPNISKNINDKIIKHFKILFDRSFIQLAPYLILNSVSLPKGFAFKKINFSETKMESTYLDNVNFHECKWKINKERIILKEEKGNEEKYLNVYREFKRNFDNLKNWEYSGIFYISEMEIRKKILWKEKKYFSWMFYQFYYLIGGYTQNFLKPTFWFIIATFIIFPFIYYFYEPTIINNLSNSFQKSIANAFPFLKESKNIIYQNWHLKSFQIFFSTILLTFIILGLRKRFRQ